MSIRISAWGRHEPTQHTPNGVGFWVVSRYDDVVAVFEDARFDHFELDGPLAWMNNNRLVGLTELPVKAFPR